MASIICQDPTRKDRVSRKGVPFTLLTSTPSSCHVLSSPLSLSRQGRWGTTDISQPVSSIFPVLHYPLGLGELQTCPFSDVVPPPLSLPCLLPPFTVPCKMVLAFPCYPNSRWFWLSMLPSPKMVLAFPCYPNPRWCWPFHVTLTQDGVGLSMLP